MSFLISLPRVALLTGIVLLLMLLFWLFILSLHFFFESPPPQNHVRHTISTKDNKSTGGPLKQAPNDSTSLPPPNLECATTSFFLRCAAEHSCTDFSSGIVVLHYKYASSCNFTPLEPELFNLGCSSNASCFST